MKFNDLVDPRELARGLNEKLISVRKNWDSSEIYNYTDAAMYTPGAWENPAVRQCRGVIVRDGEVIARPWEKFFNHTQPEAATLNFDGYAEVTDKLDGSLGILLYGRDGRPQVATRGSFESDQAKHATKLLEGMGFEWDSRITPLVEIIYPANRVVLNYGGFDGLVLLGSVDIESGDYFGPEITAAQEEWPGRTAEVLSAASLREALALAPRPNAEGVCVRQGNNIVKIKQDDYVRLHRLVTGLSERSVWEHMMAGGSLNDLLAPLPDELHDWARNTYNTFSATVASIASWAQDVHDEMVTHLLDPEFTRAEYAAIAKTHEDLAPYLFALLDDHDPTPRILKSLKPKGDTRAVVRSEATA